MTPSVAARTVVTHAPTTPGPSTLRLVPRSASNAPLVSDDAIIEAVQCGDERVARLLYDRLYAVVDRSLFRVLGRREADHDDLVQAAFEQIVITLTRRSFARGCNLKTWAASIAHHVGSTAIRSRRRERKVVDRDVSVEAIGELARVGSEARTLARIELERVREHLLAMKPKQAEAVFFHDVLGHPLTEVAALTRASVSAATSRLVRGRRELYRRLEADRGERPKSGGLATGYSETSCA
ncbi:MAG TPA: RNA polymerase sigma factor [Polyangiaceae bacterium]|nr:RNA polymerase sigma factor [Polyangiaceae bacterium]